MAMLKCCNKPGCFQDYENAMSVTKVSKSSAESAGSTSSKERVKKPKHFSVLTPSSQSSTTSSGDTPSICSDEFKIAGEKQGVAGWPRGESGEPARSDTSPFSYECVRAPAPDKRLAGASPKCAAKPPGTSLVNPKLAGCLLVAEPQEPGGAFHQMVLKLGDSSFEVRLQALRRVHVHVAQNTMGLEVLHQSAEALCRNLLEWFNLPNPSHQDTVLGILIKLAEDVYTRKQLVEIGALEFMEQFRAHSTERFLPQVTLLISKLSERDSHDPNQSSAIRSCVLHGDAPDPVWDERTSHRPWLHSIKPRQLISSPDGDSSCAEAYILCSDQDVGPTLPLIALEPADNQYLFELNERLRDVQHPQVIEDALLELRETVVVDFHPEAILQSHPIVENVLALIHALKNTPIVPLALDFLCSLCQKIKAAVSLAYEAAFQVHPHARTSDVAEEPISDIGGKVYPRAIARSYPVSMQQDMEQAKQVPGILGANGRVVLHLGRSLHMMTLQLIKLLTEIKYHQAVFKILHELLLLLKPPEDERLNNKVGRKLRTHYMQYFGALDDVVGALGGDFDDLGALCLGSIMQDGVRNVETWQLRCIPVLTVLSFTADLLSLLKPAESVGLLPCNLIKALKAVTSDLILAECNFGIHTRILPYFEFLDPDYHQSYCYAHDAYGAISAAERMVNIAHECITMRNAGTSRLKTLATTDSAILANHMSDAFPYLHDFENANLVRRFILVAINLLEIEVDSFQIKRDRSMGKLKRMKRNLGMRSDPGNVSDENLWIVFNADIDRKLAQTGNLIVDLISHSSANIRRAAYEALLNISSSERARTYQWCALSNIGFGDACEDHKDTCMVDNSHSAAIPLSPASILHNIFLRGSRILSELLTSGLHDSATCKMCSELLLHHVEFLDLQDRVQMISALSWIACSASLSRDCSTADKVANHLLHAMEVTRTSMEGGHPPYHTPTAAWTEISFFLRPLFSLSSSERCGAAHELLEALQNCCKNEGYVPWWISQTVMCANRKSPSHYTHDPFRYFLLFDREESLRGSQSVTFVNLVPSTEDRQSFECIGKRSEQVMNLLGLIKSSASCGIARRCAVEQLIKMPLSTLLPVAENGSDLMVTLVNEVVNWMKLGYQRSEESQGQINIGASDASISTEKDMGEACLRLLTRLAISPSTHEISRIRDWLVSNPKQRLEPLFPLVFHPSITVRKDMALLLTFLLFSADLLYSDLKKVLPMDDQLYSGSFVQIPYPSTEGDQVFVPSTFMSCYRFPCCAVSVDLKQADAFRAETRRCEALVHHMVEQLRLLDGDSKTLVQFHEMKSAIASVVGLSRLELQALRCICAISADYVIKSLLEHLAYPKDYEEETRQLVELAAQCSRHSEAAILLARSNWMTPFERFLTTSPSLEDQLTLLLKVLHVVELMMGTNCMTSSGLIFLATSLRDTLLPLLVSRLSAGFGQSASRVRQRSFIANQVELSILHLMFNLLLSAENHADREVFGTVLTVLLEGATLFAVLETIIVKIQSAPYTFCVLAVQSISLLAKGMAVDVACKASSDIFSHTKLKLCAQTREIGQLQGEEADIRTENDIVQLIVPMIKHIARFYGTNTPSLRFKQLVREIVYCLWSITSSISPFFWEELWASTGVTHWLSRLVTDQEGTVRGMAFGILAMLASPVTPLTQTMLLKNWPEIGLVAVRSVLNIQECYAVRQEALRFILASNFWTAACKFNIEDLDIDGTTQVDFEELDPFDINAALQKCKFWEAFPVMLKEENGTPGFYRVFLELIRRLTLTDMEFIQKQFVHVPSVFDALLRQLGCPTSDLESISRHLELCEKGRESYVTVWEKRRMHSRIQLADRYGVTAQIAEILQLLACDGDGTLDGQVSSPTMIAALICAFCQCDLDNENQEYSMLSYGTFKGPRQRMLEGQVQPARKAITQYERAEAIFHVATTLNSMLERCYAQDRKQELPVLALQQEFPRGRHDASVCEPSDEQVSEQAVVSKADDKQGLSIMHVDEILSSSGMMICTAAATVLTACPALHLLRKAINANSDDSMQGISCGIDGYPIIWRMWLSVSALLATLLSHEEKAELVLCEEYESRGSETNKVGAKHYTNQIVSGLLKVLEELYAESRKARASRDFRFLEHLVFILSAVGRALQNMVAFSPRAKKFAVQALVPEKLVKLAHESHSILAYGYVRRFHSIVRRSKRGRWVVCKARISANRRPQWNSSWQAKSAGCMQSTSSKQHPESSMNIVTEPCETQTNCWKAFGTDAVRQFRALIFEELLLSIRLLEHLVYRSSEAAEACVGSGVFTLVRSIWDFAHQNEDLLSEVLGLLTNLAAQCDQAKVVISKVGLMDGIVDLLLLPNVSTTCFGVAVSLLQTLMTRAEPRARFLRNQWLGALISQLKDQIRTRDFLRQHLLLQLLVNVSAFPHGQMVVTRHLSLDGHFELVLDIVEQGKEPAASSGLFLLRNLSFSPECQIHFLSNERTVPILLLSLQSPSVEGRTYASSAIWELLFQGNRFISVFKQSAGLLLAAEMAARADVTKLESMGGRELGQNFRGANLVRQLEQSLYSINRLIGEDLVETENFPGDGDELWKKAKELL